MELLAKKFIKLINKEDELSPPMHNSGVFVQTSKWNTRKYFKLYNRGDYSFPLLVIMRQGKGVMYLPMIGFTGTSSEAFGDYLQDQSILNKKIKEYKRYIAPVEKLYNKLTSDFITSQSEKKLLYYLKLMRQKTWEQNHFVFFANYLTLDLVKKVLQTKKINFTNDRLEAAWPLISDYVGMSFATKRLLYYIKLLNKQLPHQKIIENCQYFGASYLHVPDLKEIKILLDNYNIHFKNDIKNIWQSELAKIKLKQRRHQTEIKKLNSLEKKIAKYTQVIMSLRDVRKDYNMKYVVVAHRIAQEIFKRNRINQKYISYCAIDELLRGSVWLRSHIKEIKKRPLGFAFLVKADGSQFIQYDYKNNRIFLEKYYKKMFHNKIGDTLTLVGEVGNPGKVVGQVKIIRDVRTEGNKFKKGQILVTGMTRPEFIMLMKKSKAIITDEGGITSHAAVVSRELNIPCVIGTKIATSIFKDGDIVEVDADKGIVRKIK